MRIRRDRETAAASVELEQKLEQLSAKKNEAEQLKHVLTENERIQEELDALDLAQETIDPFIYFHPRLFWSLLK